MNDSIDVVITWVDGSDPRWQAQKKFFSTDNIDNDPHVGGRVRYSDNGLLRYLFRGIEAFMPWVRKVFFVTYGHKPEWLDLSHHRIQLVRHDEFIDKEYLPTFNSNAILLNLHRIDGLSERFILFNDDMFVVQRCSEKIFFKKGMPRDMAVMNPVVAPDNDPFWDMMLNNVMTINKAFCKRSFVRRHLFKWYNPCYGLKNLARNLVCAGYKFVPGFFDCHLPNSFMKSSFLSFWKQNEEICRETCSHRFRSSEDITEWAVRYWQLALGSFIPIRKDRLGTYCSLKDDSAKHFISRGKPKQPLVCFNDDCQGDSLQQVELFFQSILPSKSNFEK